MPNWNLGRKIFSTPILGRALKSFWCTVLNLPEHWINVAWTYAVELNSAEFEKPKLGAALV